MWNYLKKQTEKPIVLYGMGNGADKVLSICKDKEIPVAGIFASDEFARHNSFHDYTVTTYAEAKNAFADMIVLVCFGTSRPEVMERILMIAQEQELYIPDLPVYGDALFTREYADAHFSELQAVRRLLADEASVQTWDNLLLYRTTGSIPYLLQAQTAPEEVWQSILRPSNCEHYLDLGAYNGDTVKEFLSNISGYAAITALEPDAKSYQKLCANTEGLPNCRRLFGACGSIDGTCLFSAKSGRGSAVSEHGAEIPMFRVDSLSPDTPFTLVNMDVEGAEKETIEGMAETIRHDKPKLQIAAYHRTEDYYAIPLQILALQPDYKVYLRHFKGFPAWDTNFFFV